MDSTIYRASLSLQVMADDDLADEKVRGIIKAAVEHIMQRYPDFATFDGVRFDWCEIESIESEDEIWSDDVDSEDATE